MTETPNLETFPPRLDVFFSADPFYDGEVDRSQLAALADDSAILEDLSRGWDRTDKEYGLELYSVSDWHHSDVLKLKGAKGDLLYRIR